MEAKVPSLYRLTYVKAFQDKPPATDQWRALENDKQVRDTLRRVWEGLAEERALKRQIREARKHKVGGAVEKMVLTGA